MSDLIPRRIMHGQSISPNWLNVFAVFPRELPVPPNLNWGARDLICVRRCPTFPPGLGSIIGAGRLSFRVRDGSGRFPVAISAVTLFCWGGVIGGGVGVVGWVWLRVLVSFRPVSASSLRPLRGV